MTSTSILNGCKIFPSISISTWTATVIGLAGRSSGCVDECPGHPVGVSASESGIVHHCFHILPDHHRSLLGPHRSRLGGRRRNPLGCHILLVPHNLPYRRHIHLGRLRIRLVLLRILRAQHIHLAHILRRLRGYTCPARLLGP